MPFSCAMIGTSSGRFAPDLASVAATRGARPIGVTRAARRAGLGAECLAPQRLAPECLVTDYLVTEFLHPEFALGTHVPGNGAAARHLAAASTFVAGQVR